MNPELPSSPKPLPPPAPPSGGQQPSTPPRATGKHAALLRAIRSQQRKELWLQGFAAGAALFALFVLLGGVVGASFPNAGRLLFYAAPVVFLASLTFFGIVLARKLVGDDVRTARLLRDRVPGIGDDVLSAVELHAELQGDAVSHALINAFIERTDARVGHVSARNVVDRRTTQRMAMGALALALGCVLVGALTAARWKKGFALAMADRKDQTAAALAEPITGDIELNYTYPAHTAYAPRNVPGTNGEISAPLGTRVQLKTRADRKVGKAELVFENSTVPLNVADERELSGELVVQKAGAYRFRFFTARGRQLAEGPPISINVEADAAPVVKVLTPGDEVEVDPGQKLTLKYDVSDDFGVTDLELVYRQTGVKEEVRQKLPKDEGRSVRNTFTWDLAPLKLKPGHRVSYYVEAKDNDAVSGPKKGVSRTLQLKTYSAAEHRREALQRAEALWERMVTQLADRMEGPDRRADHTLDEVKSQVAVDEAGFKLTSDMQFSVAEMSKSRDAPIELMGALSNIAGTLAPKQMRTSSTRRLAIRNAASRPSDVDLGRRLIRVVEDEIAELEKDVLYLEALIDRHKIEDLKELAKELAQDRRELAQLVEDYKKTNDPAKREQILQDVAEMRERINELMQRMAELAKGIRDEHFNSEAMAEMMQEDNMAASMDEIDKLLREGKIDEALKKLSEMSMQIEEMIQEMEEADGELGDQLDPELAAQFQKFAEDFSKTVEQQEKLAEQTKELRDKYRQKAKERLAQKGKQLREELLKDVEKLSREYQQMTPEELGSYGGKNLEATQAELENMRNALQIEDYDLAAEAGARAEQSSQQVSMAAENMAARDELYQNPEDAKQESRKKAEAARQGQKDLREVNEKLSQLFPDPNQMMSAEDKQKMKQQAQQQKGLQQQAQNLQQQMDDLADKAPIFDPEAQQQMQQAGQFMEDAQQKLEAKDASRGHGDQRMALEALRKLQQQMQQQGKGKRGMPLPMMSGGRSRGQGNRNEKIEIPDEDQHQAPKEFRKDLMDAMKEGAPDRYKDQVKRYYEELVK